MEENSEEMAGDGATTTTTTAATSDDSDDDLRNVHGEETEREKEKKRCVAISSRVPSHAGCARAPGVPEIYIYF